MPLRRSNEPLFDSEDAIGQARCDEEPPPLRKKRRRADQRLPYPVLLNQREPLEG